MILGILMIKKYPNCCLLFWNGIHRGGAVYMGCEIPISLYFLTICSSSQVCGWIIFSYFSLLRTNIPQPTISKIPQASVYWLIFPYLFFGELFSPHIPQTYTPPPLKLLSTSGYQMRTHIYLHIFCNG